MGADVRRCRCRCCPAEGENRLEPWPPRHVIKHTGELVAFDAQRVRSAVKRAGKASGEFGTDDAQMLTARTTEVLSHKFHAFIVYREQFAHL